MDCVSQEASLGPGGGTNVYIPATVHDDNGCLNDEKQAASTKKERQAVTFAGKQGLREGAVILKLNVGRTS